MPLRTLDVTLRPRVALLKCGDTVGAVFLRGKVSLMYMHSLCCFFRSSRFLKCFKWNLLNSFDKKNWPTCSAMLYMEYSEGNSLGTSLDRKKSYSTSCFTVLHRISINIIIKSMLRKYITTMYTFCVRVPVPKLLFLKLKSSVQMEFN